ncbi:NlpC/P60 family protein [Campylobacter hyointestinalis]|uniref:NlpC/P60 family protein n=1 Tax=Campylobacter hyointestinalis TaxID=198 RepID=UPI000DCCCDB0|nr:NlpC/P60 family protein [Campylobacter hyointestinalis]RAZ52441.1 hypothetical protein CHL10075_02765 [Campylobacter hyointestinalis subsp. lawsonii]
MLFKGVLTISALLFILSGCSTKSIDPKQNSYDNADSKYQKNDTTSGYNYNQDADGFYNINLSKYLNKKLGNDCSGFVSLVNEDSKSLYFDENIVNNFYDKNGRKSQAIFNLYKSQNKISYTDPKPGDLVFFNNTTSRTNKSKNKAITHLGIIDKVESNGTITFMHNINGKNIKSVMNLNHKNTHKLNGKKINAYIILKCQTPACLISNKFAGFGKVDKNVQID